ncbi:MAG: hypothetical protein HQK52_15985 [Oligoflexia bacterium]|nr:hypothetical protein [Oligoflexia bacterium]
MPQNSKKQIFLKVIQVYLRDTNLSNLEEIKERLLRARERERERERESKRNNLGTETHIQVPSLAAELPADASSAEEAPIYLGIRHEPVTKKGHRVLSYVMYPQTKFNKLSLRIKRLKTVASANKD